MMAVLMSHIESALLRVRPSTVYSEVFLHAGRDNQFAAGWTMVAVLFHRQRSQLDKVAPEAVCWGCRRRISRVTGKNDCGQKSKRRVNASKPREWNATMLAAKVRVGVQAWEQLQSELKSVMKRRPSKRRKWNRGKSYLGTSGANTKLLLSSRAWLHD